MKNKHRACQAAKPSKQAPLGINPSGQGLRCWHLPRAALSTPPKVQGGSLALPSNSLRPGLRPVPIPLERGCPLALVSPGSGSELQAHSGCASSGRHAAGPLGGKGMPAAGYKPGRCSGHARTASAPAAPRPQQQALPDILRVWEGEEPVQTSRRGRLEAGGRVWAGRLPGHPQPPPP